LDATGELALRVLTPAATLKAFFPNLSPPPGLASADEGAVVCVRVESRKLAAGLGAYGLDVESIACFPHERRALHLFATLADGLGSLSFFCPVVDDADDPEDDAG
jgi:hypothetical protein